MDGGASDNDVMDDILAVGTIKYSPQDVLHSIYKKGKTLQEVVLSKQES